MRRAILVLTVMTTALLLASGVALAVTETGDAGDNVLRGSNEPDTLSGGGGDDRLYGYGARDRLYGDSGADRVFGGGGPDQLFGGQGFDRVFGDGGDDFINVADEHRDVVECGAGFDEVWADFPQDKVRSTGGACEAVFEFSAEPA